MERQKSGSPPVRTRSMLPVVLLLTFLSRADTSMMQANNPLFARSLGASLLVVSATSSMYALSTLLVRFSWSARLRPAHLPSALAWGFTLLGLSLWATADSGNLGFFLLSVAVSGVATAFVMPHLLTLANLVTPAERVNRSLSLFSLALSLSLVVAPVAGTGLLTRYGLHTLYGMLAGIALTGALLAHLLRGRLSAALARRLGGRQAGEPARLWHAAGRLARTPLYMHTFWVGMLFNLTFAGTLTFGGVYARERFHLAYAGVEGLITAFFVASLIGRLLLDRRIRRGTLEREHRILQGVLVASALAMLLMAGAPSLPLYLAGMILLAVPHALLFPIATMRIARSVPHDMLVPANTLFQAAFDLSSIAGPLALSPLAARSIPLAFLALAVVQPLGIAFLAREGTSAFAPKGQHG